MASKVCRECRQEKSIEEFYSHPNTKDGRAGICKDCQRAYVQGRYSRKRPVYPMGQKFCPRCRQVFALDAFDKNAARTDGRQAYCRECWPKYQQKWRATPSGLEGQRVKFRASRQDPQKKRKDKARLLTNLAIQFGYLVRQPCEVCGSLKVDAHHTQYEKPLDGIRWLCEEHHKTSGHGGSFTNPPQ